MSSLEGKIIHMDSHVKGFVDKTFENGDLEKNIENEQSNFENLSEGDQIDSLFQVQSLIAERRDIIHSIHSDKDTEQVSSQSETNNIKYVIKKIAGRPVRIPVHIDDESGVSIDKEHKEKAIESTEDRLSEIKTELSRLNSIDGLKEAYGDKVSELYFQVKMMSSMENYSLELESINAEIESIKISSGKTESGTVVGLDSQYLESLEAEKLKIEDKLNGISNEESIGPFLSRMRSLKEYTNSAEKDRMVEVGSTKKVVNNLLKNMRSHQPYMLAGHLGSGKTEIARHAARIFMIENGIGFNPEDFQNPDDIYEILEPEIFSGAEEASVYDLIGKLKLTGSDTSNPDVIAEHTKKIAKRFEEIGVKGIEENEISKLLLGKSDVTETVFNYGPLGRAIRDGKPIIIDEINLMRPEIIGRINDILLKKEGSEISIQENGEDKFTVKPGFAVIATLNLGSQYSGIQDFNAAFASRWVGAEIDYPEVDETFDLILSTIMRKDRLRLPPDFPAEEYDKLIDLSVTVREIQEIFSGRIEGSRFMAKANSVTAEKSQLEKVVVSTRDVMRKIIKPWKESNFTKPLDSIIAENILASAAIQSKDEQKFITEIFLRRGFFNEWSEQDFVDFGIDSVSDSEIKALTASMDSDDFKEYNQHFDDLLGDAHNRSNITRQSMLIGNKDLMQKNKHKQTP